MRNPIRTVLGLVLAGGLSSGALADGRKAQPQPRVAEATQAGTAAGLQEQAVSALSVLSEQQVRDVQAALRKSGHYKGELDGQAGPATQTAVTAFQRDRAIEAAFLTRETVEALGVNIALGAEPATAEVPAPAHPAVQEPVVPAAPVVNAEAPAPAAADRDMGFALDELKKADLEAFQRKLRELGHYEGQIDGLDGPRTRQAFRDFFNAQLGLMTTNVRLTREGGLALGVDLSAPELSSTQTPAATKPALAAGTVATARTVTTAR